MIIDGYEGICACCFDPIKEGESQKLRENGRNFHKKCILEQPYNYYVKLEKRLANKHKSGAVRVWTADEIMN